MAGSPGGSGQSEGTGRQPHLPGCWSRYASTRLLRMWFLQIRSTGQRQVGHSVERSIQPE